MMNIIIGLMVIPVWSNVFFYLFIGLLLLFIISWLYFIKIFRKRSGEMKIMQQQFATKVDSIRKEHADTLEKIRVEMLKREEERTRQWIESEKEALHVLNGVSTLLDLSEKIGKIESDKILQKFEDILNKVSEIHVKVEKISKS